MRCQSLSLIATFILSALATGSLGARFPITHRLAPSHWGGAGQAHRRWKMCDGWPAGPAPLGMLSRCSRTSERNHLGGVRFELGAVRCPGVHQLAALVEQVATPVGGLHGVRDRVGERHLGNFTREVGALGGPIA